ncbi:MAG: tRNA (N(6)-L-threonylcarbamoyladenosine(37)-C(2))-methylthiotransferase [Candidatus Micrarchaeota archaeon]
MRVKAVKVYIKTYGCTFNQADSDRMALLLKEHANEITETEEQADVIVLNSCSVKDATQQKILWKASHTAKPLVIAGCLVQATPKIVGRHNPSASLIGTFSQGSIAEAVQAAFEGKRLVLTSNNGIPRLNPTVEGVISRIQVNAGCASSCTFCSTKLARGGVKSYRPREVIETIERMVSLGAREIQLTSQDTGAYGMDCGVTLPQLLERICEIPGNFKVRVGMLNPQHFLRLEEKLLQAFGNGKVYKFFHIPVQSASDSVLKHMRRGYSSEQAERAVESVRKKFPNAVLGTDIIVGYPTESKEDFEETLEFLKRERFDVVNVSKYSARPKTIAAGLKQLDNKEVKKRSEVTSALVRRISLEKNKKLVGTQAYVLVTEKDGKGAGGRTGEYRKVVLKRGKLGETVRVKVAGARIGCLIGTRA